MSDRKPKSSPPPEKPAKRVPAHAWCKWARWYEELKRDLEKQYVDQIATSAAWAGVMRLLRDRAERAEAVVEVAREMLFDWPKLRTAIEEHDAATKRIGDAALEKLLGKKKAEAAGG